MMWLVEFTCNFIEFCSESSVCSDLLKILANALNFLRCFLAHVDVIMAEDLRKSRSASQSVGLIQFLYLIHRVSRLGLTPDSVDEVLVDGNKFHVALRKEFRASFNNLWKWGLV